MSRRKSLQYYPQEYWDSVRDSALGGKGRHVVCPTMKHALSLRGHFYAFIGSLRWEAERLAALPSRTPAEEEIVHLATVSARVMVQVSPGTDGSATVSWLNRDESWQAKLMKTSVVDDVPVTEHTASDDFLRRVAEIQGSLDGSGKHGPEGNDDKAKGGL